MSDEFWLNVVIPTFNGGKYLDVTFESAYQNKLEGVEFIVIDDGSTDNTIDIIEAWRDRLSLNIIERKAGNWTDNTNYAMEYARGEYLCFLHQDDMWLKDRLLAIKDVIKDHPEVAMFLNQSYFIDSEGNRCGYWTPPLPALPTIIESKVMIKRLLVQQFIANPAPVFKREAALDVGMLDTKLWYTADWDFWLKLANSGPVAYLDKTLTCFRIHAESQTILGSKSAAEFRQQLEDAFYRFFDASNLSDQEKATLLPVAKFSIEVNTSLASKFNNLPVNWFELLWDFIRLGPIKQYQYIKYSCIIERVVSRLRAGFIKSPMQLLGKG